MIKNIIFDFGDIFIDLDKEVVFREIEKNGGNPELTPELLAVNHRFEVGEISPEEFVVQLGMLFPNVSPNEIIRIWNSMLLDFPDYRLEFIETLATEDDYRLFLLSNTNALHIPHVQKIMGHHTYRRFQNCFEQFYLSHEIHLRKPDFEVFEFVLDQNNLKATETFFVDDTKENTDAATSLGIKCWHLQVGKEDITELKNKL